MAWLNEEVAALLREYAEYLSTGHIAALDELRAKIPAGVLELTGRLEGLAGFGARRELIVSRTEEEVYDRLGLAWIPPAMREDHGEVEAAGRGQIPGLVREKDLRGDLHTHTNLTDGVASLEDMVAAAARRGYELAAGPPPRLPAQGPDVESA